MQQLQQLRCASPLRIGLLGGSFNPAHHGHRHISHYAMRCAKLDYVIWLVSPANPHKDPATLAPFHKRLNYALYITQQDKRIIVSDIEQQAQLHYTAHTLRYIRAHYGHHHFSWLMGSDNLVSFHRWQKANHMMYTMPVIILDRAPCTHTALRSRMALRYSQYRDASGAQSLPCWRLLFIPRHGESATNLRKTFGEKAFLCDNKDKATT